MEIPKIRPIEIAWRNTFLPSFHSRQRRLYGRTALLVTFVVIGAARGGIGAHIWRSARFRSENVFDAELSCSLVKVIAPTCALSMAGSLRAAPDRPATQTRSQPPSSSHFPELNDCFVICN